ncbi:MAG: dihydrofolate reductase [Lysobacterales bacterium]
MTTTLIAAMDNARAIGVDGGLPWHLPADLKHFKQTTLGKSVVMGRRTFEEVGRPLPGRQNIVLSRSLLRPPKGCELAITLEQALALATSTEVMIIGGGEIYRAALGSADRLVITHVDTRVDRADTWFPRIIKSRWSGWTMRSIAADAGNAFDFRVVEYLPRILNERVLCRTPSVGKKPTRIPQWKFELLRGHIVQILADADSPVLFAELRGLVGSRLNADQRKRLGSLGWHCTCVKLELEVAGEIQRLRGSGPQLLALA